ncbi:MAG TPA: DNA polymerase III subunit epsilon [Moraxellaceae bacterium]|nr:DNA polymerase III subunit epsilon [Moraxellaceae bacterium]
MLFFLILRAIFFDCFAVSYGLLSMSNHALTPLVGRTLAYTDGACRGNPGKGGFGAVVILPTGEQIDICGGEAHTTNNRMELMGAIAALENSPKALPIQIWSDSSYVIKGISEWLAGWKKKHWKNVKNVELWQRLDGLCQQRQIDWQWVKGHAGHDGNEYADKLANQGIDQLPKSFNKVIKNPPNPTTDLDVKSDFSDKNPDFDSKKKDPTMNPMSTDNNPVLNHSALTGDFSDTSFDDAQDLEFADSEMMGDIFLQALDGEPAPSTIQTSADVSTQSSLGGQPTHSPTSANPHFAVFTNPQGQFVAQDDSLIAQRPVFNGITSQPNPTFIPLLPIAKHKGTANRQLILDTETTGFEAQNGDRIIEVGIVEMINRRFTGEKLHVYINPKIEMGEEVIRVHGIHNVFLNDMPVFEQVGEAIYDFLQGAELIAHNAGFDMSFLQAEFARLGLPDIHQAVTVTDSLAIAKRMFAGQRNTLDALVKRLNVGKQDRTFHGALLDAEILAEVYLAMTGGQVALAIDDDVGGGVGGATEHQRFSTTIKRFLASSDAEQAHLKWLNALKDKNPQLAENWASV